MMMVRPLPVVSPAVMSHGVGNTIRLMVGSRPPHVCVLRSSA